MQYLFFTAPWCPKCVQLKESLDSDKIDYVDVSVEEQKGMDFKIMSLPTLVIMEDNQEVERLINPSLHDIHARIN